MPYEYYVLLRFCFCGAALYYLARPIGVRNAERWMLVGLAVLFNPLVPIELDDKRVWSFVSIATVAYFWLLDRRPTSRLHE